MCGDMLRQTGTANRHLDGFVDDAGVHMMATGDTASTATASHSFADLYGILVGTLDSRAEEIGAMHYRFEGSI
jgi:hypothetical protein